MFSLRHLLTVYAIATTAIGASAESSPLNKRVWIQPNPKNGKWIDTWASMPQLTEPANLPPAPFNETGAVFVDSTIRQTVRVTVGSPQIRLKISNAFGVTNLPITAVTIALPANNTAGGHQIKPETLQTLTFSGEDSVTIPNGALAQSDAANFKVKAGDIVTVTIYLKDGQTTNSITSHPGSRTTSWWQRGNAVNAASLEVTNTSTQSAAHWYFISSIEAWVPNDDSYGTFVIIGDSITDGRGSDTNKNNRWPDMLQQRLQRDPATRHISVSNLAAGGNRILADGLGPNAWSRIERDVLSHPNVKYAMIFEGVNDIGTAPATVEAQEAVLESLKMAYKQMVTRFHSFGIPVFVGTITPFSAPSNFTGQPYSDPVREETRRALNSWFLSSTWFDGKVNFDLMLRDEANPTQLKKEFDTGDYLHPNPTAYKYMGDNFPVQLFQRFKDGVSPFI